MRLEDHPEFVKVFSTLTAPTCAACLLHEGDADNMDALIEVFEQTAKRAQCLANGFCRICREYKAVIHPA